MASFGAVTSSNTFAVDALNAVDDIIMAVKKWNATRQQNKADAVLIGMGVAVGEIVFGIIGNKERLEYTVIGEASNLAAKLEKQNKIEHTQALTTQLTFTQAIKQGYKGTNKEQRLACSVVGIEEPVNLVVLA
jgi:adenylate cyclase